MPEDTKAYVGIPERIHLKKDWLSQHDTCFCNHLKKIICILRNIWNLGAYVPKSFIYTALGFVQVPDKVPVTCLEVIFLREDYNEK